MIPRNGSIGCGALIIVRTRRVTDTVGSRRARTVAGEGVDIGADEAGDRAADVDLRGQRADRTGERLVDDGVGDRHGIGVSGSAGQGSGRSGRSGIGRSGRSGKSGSSGPSGRGGRSPTDRRPELPADRRSSVRRADHGGADRGADRRAAWRASDRAAGDVDDDRLQLGDREEAHRARRPGRAGSPVCGSRRASAVIVVRPTQPERRPATRCRRPRRWPRARRGRPG